MTTQYTNHLINEKSPYLQQHAHNPVDWYPWGDEALNKARADNKPILLSIGYSSCHWCHVMEKESFENEAITALMNKNFVCIKVDREERPDLDQIYQNALQLFMERGGGWPLTMFLTPDGKVPFYGGTYFPPQPRYGMPSFPQVLEGVAETYHKEPEKVRQNVSFVTQVFKQMGEESKTPQEPTVEGMVQAISGLARIYDPEYGGFGTGTKFPSTQSLENLLRLNYRMENEQPPTPFSKGEERGSGTQPPAPFVKGEGTGPTARNPKPETRNYLEMVTNTLTKMAEGGIYDHLGGGFHRYSVDRKWLVPHFEKMLYDNALLVPLYLSCYQITGEVFYRKIAEEVLAYVEREMLSPEGGFYSTQDADTEGMEGKFFIWSQKEILEVLGEADGNLFNLYYGVTKEGNFEEENILHVVMPLSTLAQVSGKSPQELETILSNARKKLFEVRQKRVRPGRDDKILVSWNCLMISAFFKAYEVLGEERYREIGEKAVRFVVENLYREGRLLSVYKDGPSSIKGYLDDYAFFIAALLDGYETVGARSPVPPQDYLGKAEELTQSLIAHFWDEAGKGFFFTADDHEALLHRPKTFVDQSLPSGNGVMAMNLLRFYYLTGREDYLKKGEAILQLAYPDSLKAPYGYGSILTATDFYLSTPWEILLVGRSDDPIFLEWQRKLSSHYLPNRTLAVVTEKSSPETIPPSMREGFVFPKDGKPFIRICHEKRCLPIVRSLEELEKSLF